MNEPTLKAVFAELETEMTGSKFGKIFPLSRRRFVIDFRLQDSKFLFISIEPTSPRIYIVRRRFKDLEKLSKNPTSFVQFLRNRLSNGIVEDLEKFEAERILRFTFATRNDVGQDDKYFLVVQLTGRSANLFLLDKNGFIMDSAVENRGAGQEIGEKYAPPRRESGSNVNFESEVISRGDFASFSEALDNFYLDRDSEIAFLEKAKSARAKINGEIGKRKKLVNNLTRDLENHGDADKWKRYGDLLLANIATAKRKGSKILVIDYFEENTPTIEIDVDENRTINEAAESYFKKYTKARNAGLEIEKRLETVNRELQELNIQSAKIETAINEKDESLLLEFAEKRPSDKTGKKSEKQVAGFSGARKFLSSDGFEILVGKRAKDNDFLTFRVAKSLDLWLHAADYAGSHVVVRNPNRKEIPQNTLLEAAQIAAFYSQAKNQPKAAVNFTQKKFVNKPKGAAHGLVSLASFKTILVEPKIFEQ